MPPDQLMHNMNLPRQGLLGNAPPGFNPMMVPPGGRPMMRPRGPVPPMFRGESRLRCQMEAVFVVVTVSLQCRRTTCDVFIWTVCNLCSFMSRSNSNRITLGNKDYYYYLLTHLLTHPVTHSVTRLFSHSHTFSLIHSFATHLLTLSLVHSGNHLH